MKDQKQLLWSELRWVNRLLKEEPNSADREAHLRIRAAIIDNLENLGCVINNQPLETPAGAD